MAYKAVFKRVEKKYLLGPEQYARLRKRLETYMEPDEYGEATVYSLYFDTPDSRLIRQSLEKPVYKEKLRLRTYGEPRPDSHAFVELKKKYKGVVYKRRVEMPYGQALAWLRDGQQPPEMGQIEAEIQWALDFYRALGPAMELRYDRSALRGRNDPELRITFDRDIRGREATAGDWMDIIPGDHRLMEIKITGGMPLWLADLLDELGIFPHSFSKYGTAYQRRLAPAAPGKTFIKGENICA